MKYLGLTLDDQLTGEAIVKKSMVGLNFFIDNVTFWRKNLGNPYVLHLSNVT